MTEIICLANSFKNKNRCIAGINFGTGEWIRPVTNAEDGHVPTNLTVVSGEPVEILDRIDIPISQEKGNGHESENRLILSGSWTRNGKAKPSDLLRYRETNLLHYQHENWLRAIPYSYLKSLPRHMRRTLQLMQTDDLKCFKTQYGKWIGSITIVGSDITLVPRITDPEMCKLLDCGHRISSSCIVILSLGQPWKRPDSDDELICYRLIVGIIELSGNEFCPIADLIERTDQEIQRVGWSIEQARDYLNRNFQKRSRTLLDLRELREFLNHLKKLPNFYDDFF
jgi:hypothetical protein